ncbi:MAG: tRNA lysidine(34) synthetase TilS [Fusobacteriaceae bacterium]
MKFLKEAIKFIDNYKMFEKGDKIIIGFSGGPDSVFLLELLMEYKKIKDETLELYLVHINHGLRGEASDGDEEFVNKIGKKYSIKVFSKKIDIEKISLKEKKGLEEIGREVRYKFFEEILKEVKGNKIVSAHNKDDQLETFMFRMMRGSSLEGLEGISLKKGIYRRPIINIYKSEIIGYLNSNKIEYRVDETNFENEFTRNSIRLDLIPFIEKRYNPKFKDKLFNLIEDIREVNEELKIENDKIIKDNKILIEDLIKYSKIIQKKIINNYLNINKLKSDRYKISSVIELLQKGGTKKISIDKDNFLVKNYEYIFIEKKKSSERNNSKNECLKCELKIPGSLIFGNYQVKATLEDLPIEGKNSFNTNLKLGDKLVIRTREAGDRIIPTGLNMGKKVKDILINSKIPIEIRKFIPIFLHNEDIVWIGGVRGSDNFKYLDKEKNKKIIVLSIGRNKVAKKNNIN